MTLKTFDEWKKEGKYVIKGQHCCCRKNGKCYFNENQVATLEQVIASRKIQLEEQRNKLKADKEIYYRCKNKNIYYDHGDVKHTKEDTLDWLSYQGSSVYNENCNPLDSMGVSDVSLMLLGYDDIY